MTARVSIVGAALVAAVGLGATQARAEGASPWIAEPLRSSAVGAATGQPPLRLLRPIASETVARALREAESLYRGRQHAAALHAYGTLVEMDPSLARAWLRLGNLHQQAGREDEALDAYRQAALGPGAVSPDLESRGKALLNIALLGVAQAGRAIDELDALDVELLDDPRDAVARQVGAQRRRVQRATGRWAEADTGRPVAQPGAVPAPPTSGTWAAPSPAASWPASASPAMPAAVPGRPASDVQEAVEPYTVDRWIAAPRRSGVRRDGARGRISEPVVETPLPPIPAVETFRGLQGGARP
ncbi:MAG: hypothetical protein RJA99_593 [Pseudomonadota bacterium]|jgi:tetratricopeptide (TPR) repeat protein